MHSNLSSRPACLDKSDETGRPLLRSRTDRALAPITFAWWAYSPDVPAGQRRLHLETVYRLDRVGDDTRPNCFTAMTSAQMRAYVIEARGPGLPELPEGQRWVGPELIENICVVDVPVGLGKAGFLRANATQAMLDRQVAGAAL